MTVELKNFADDQGYDNAEALPITTERLLLGTLQISDAAFIRELVNSAGWLEYIGDRHVKSLDDAIAYINKILISDHITYWVVRLKETLQPIGIITKIKRETLQNSDIGFAFLPNYHGFGFAYEATLSVLYHLDEVAFKPTFIAMTLAHNQPSVSLLEKLGFEYSCEIIDHGETLALYQREKRE